MDKNKAGEHTQGEWRVEASDDKLMVLSLSEKEGLNAIANINLWPRECEANARLIASAPKMLEALEKLTEFWLTKDGNENNQSLKVKLAHGCPELQLYIENAEAAIKAAKGE